MRLLTAIPVYNEETSLVGVLTEVLKHAGDVLVVDDGSTDRTPLLLRAFPTVRTIRHPRNLGYGAGLRTAFQATIDGGYDGVVTLDCDGQHEPERIPEIGSRLADADIVSGSRYLRVFDPGQKPPEERRRINVEVTRWLNECLGLNLTDAFCGFKAYRTTALEAVQHHRKRLCDAAAGLGPGRGAGDEDRGGAGPADLPGRVEGFRRRARRRRLPAEALSPGFRGGARASRPAHARKGVWDDGAPSAGAATDGGLLVDPARGAVAGQIAANAEQLSRLGP